MGKERELRVVRSCCFIFWKILKFLSLLKNRSEYQFEVDLNKDDKILTLSTCAGNGKKRLVVHAVLIKE